MAINPEKCQHLDSSVDNIDISLGHFKGSRSITIIVIHF